MRSTSRPEPAEAAGGAGSAADAESGTFLSAASGSDASESSVSAFFSVLLACAGCNASAAKIEKKTVDELMTRGRNLIDAII